MNECSKLTLTEPYQMCERRSLSLLGVGSQHHLRSSLISVSGMSQLHSFFFCNHNGPWFVKRRMSMGVEIVDGLRIASTLINDVIV